MLSFKQYLEEVKRDDDRAMKLGNYLAKRHKKYGHHFEPKPSIALKNQDEITGAHLDHHPELQRITHQDFYNQPTTRIHLASIIPTQHATHFWPAGARKKFKDTDPMYVVHYRGNHYQWDGHHRNIGLRLHGETHGDAKVVKISDDY